MDDPSIPQDADDASLSHQRVRQTFSLISLILGLCAPVATMVFPLLMRSGLSGTAVRLISLSPPMMMLAGLGMAIAARRRGERGSLNQTALAWNTLLVILYAVMLTALFMNPVTPS